MRLFDRFYILGHGAPDEEKYRLDVPKTSIDKLMAKGVRVYREDGIWGNILRWIRS